MALCPLPSGRVVGISKLARVVDAYAKRLQIQEKMTAQIANTIDEVLKPQGVGIILRATHHCMTTRGVHKPDTDLVTSRMLGCFRDIPLTRQELLSLIDSTDQVPRDPSTDTPGLVLIKVHAGRIYYWDGLDEAKSPSDAVVCLTLMRSRQSELRSHFNYAVSLHEKQINWRD